MAVLQIRRGTPLSEVASNKLLAEWDYEKNGGLTPNDVSGHSGQKVWWKCNKGHSWQSVISNRTGQGRGCPYCSGQHAIPGENDLETVRPDIAAQLVDKRLVSKLMVGSGKKVEWECEKGHKWIASVYDRVRGRGCPYCSGRKILVGYNDLATTHPEIAAQLVDQSLATQLTRGSNKKVEWQCDQGHRWFATVNSRREAFVGCPYCSGQLPIVGETDLVTTHPNIAAEWDYEKNGNLKPIHVKARSGKKVWWKCSEGHSWQAFIYSRTGDSGGCPYCAGKCAIVGKTDLVTTHPDIAAEWDYEKNGSLLPQDVMAGTGKKVWWICSKGHSYYSLISNRTNPYNNCGCPYCSGSKVLVGFNDLATTHSDIIEEWDYEKNGDLKPSNVMPGTHKKVWWLCSKGHSYFQSVSHHVSGEGCPYCSGHRLLSGFNDLKTVYPDIAAEWDYARNGGLKPSDIMPGIHRKVWWVCASGHSYQCKVGNRVFLNRGCPYCAGRYAVVGDNDLATTHPDIAAEWDYDKNGELKPSDVMAGTTKKVWWVCSEGHSYYSLISNRTNPYNNCGCPYCVNKKILVGFNDLATTYPDVAAEWNYDKNVGLTPNDVTAGSNKKVWWVCSSGHTYDAVIVSRTSNGSGCPICKQSHGEKFVEQHLKQVQFVFKQQWKNSKCRCINLLPFDFAIFSDELLEIPIACIEYQGEQHYHPVSVFGGKKSFKSQQKRDAIKREFCEQNGIPLILIPFSFNTQELVDEMLDVCFKELGID